MVTPALALVLAAVALGEWACAPRVGSAPLDPHAAPASLVATASAATLPRQDQPQDSQSLARNARPASLTQLDAQATVALRGPTAEEMDRRIRERESAAAATAAAAAFPVSRRIEMSSTMYCLKGHMRTGVRTRDGMAAGDPGVLPLGSVVRVSRPSGELIGIFVIMDTGGAIRGNKIDLYVDSCAEAERWGRHPVVTEVLDIGKRI